MENLNNEFVVDSVNDEEYDTNYVNHLKRREPEEEVKSDEEISPDEAYFNYLKARGSVQREEKEKRKVVLRKIAVAGALAGSIAGVTTMGTCAANKITEKNLAEATSIVATYDKNHILDNPNSETSIAFASGVNSKNNLIKYIHCSNELHSLDLSQYPDITYFKDEVIDWKDPEEVEQLIKEYKHTKVHVMEKTVGDSIIDFNHQVYELRELEKMYNEKVFEGYGYLEDYGELSTKFYLADIYGGNPEQYTVDSSNFQRSENPELSGPGIHYGDGFDGDLLDYTKIINDIRKAETAKTDIEPEEFNSDRNRLLLLYMQEMDVNAANVINDIKKQKTKEIEKSQKQYKEFSEMKK